MVIAAARTGLEACESDPHSATVNVEAPLALAARAMTEGRRVIFISSDAVFDGRRPFCDEEHPASPLTAYGRQKVEAERCLRLLPGWDTLGAVVRLTKVVSGDMPLLRAWQESLDHGRTIAPFSDLVFAPVSMRFAVTGLLQIAMSSYGGTMHLSGAADMSYADFARRWVVAQGLDSALVEATTSRQAGIRLLHSPRHCALGMARTQGLTGIMPHVAQSVIDEVSRAGTCAR